MTLKDEITNYVHNTFASQWSTTAGLKIPTTDSAIGLGNVGVHIDAVVLYADLSDSTELVSSRTDEFAAEVYKTYVYSAAKAIRFHGGQVTAYDGDRVMGVFKGNTMRNDATKAALRISGIVEKIIQPELDAQYGAGKYDVQQKVGVDQSTLLVANTGLRGNNDYVWVGNAANNAAKMAALKLGYSSYITQEVYSYLEDGLKKTDSGATVWTSLGTHVGKSIYGSNFFIETS